METKEISHAEQNARGWSETISALVAAMNADYDRLEELRDEMEALADAVKDTQAEYMDAKTDEDIAEAQEAKEKAAAALAEWGEENAEELAELRAAVTVDGEEMKDADSVRERIQESPLSVQVRSGWVTPGEAMEAEEFEILLSTGGPALRIMGELDEHKQPRRAWLEYQDWGTPWTEFHGEGAPSQDALVTFCSQFYFGE